MPLGKVIALFNVVEGDASVQLALLHRLHYTTTKTLRDPVDGSTRYGVHSRTWMPYTRLEEATLVGKEGALSLITCSVIGDM